MARVQLNGGVKAPTKNSIETVSSGIRSSVKFSEKSPKRVTQIRQGILQSLNLRNTRSQLERKSLLNDNETKRSSQNCKETDIRRDLTDKHKAFPAFVKAYKLSKKMRQSHRLAALSSMREPNSPTKLDLLQQGFGKRKRSVPLDKVPYKAASPSPQRLDFSGKPDQKYSFDSKYGT